MTTAYVSQSPMPFEALAARVGSRLAELQQSWAQHRAYRRALAEMRALPTDTLLDLDLDRAGLNRTVRAAMNRN